MTRLLQFPLNTARLAIGMFALVRWMERQS